MPREISGQKCTPYRKASEEDRKVEIGHIDFKRDPAVPGRWIRYLFYGVLQITCT